MDPEMFRIAQEQMSRIPPDELLKMQRQMFSNPDLMRMATEGMKNMKPEDLRMAAEQMKHMPPEQIASMANPTPEQIAAMSAQSDYQYRGALMLKEMGNQLHGSGNYAEAIEKYAKAKSNLIGAGAPDASSLRVTCSLNLMSCYLKTSQYENAVKEGSEVLATDSDNLKALYRRGQAYKALHQLDLAVVDLTKAAAIAHGDETVTSVLQEAKAELARRGSSVQANSNGPVIEEITEEEAERLTQAASENSTEDARDSTAEQSSTREASSTSSFPGMSLRNDQAHADALNSMKQNPDMLRSMQSLMSSVDPEQLAAMSGGKMTPEMAKLATDMMKHMSPSDMERMVDMASSMSGSNQGNSGRQAEITRVPSPVSAASSQSLRPEEDVSGMPSNDQVRKQLKDPAMREIMSSMMKNMSPEAMANMSQQFGIQLTPEQAAQAQTAMANLSPDQLETMMKWTERAQVVAQQVKRSKDWILGKKGLLFAVIMLIIAFVLHKMGFIGN